jgi:hypothetical protein
MLTSITRWTGAAALLTVLALAGIAPANAAGLVIARPREGATVREIVKVEVPASSIPSNGFAALYIDGQFRVAQAPPVNSRKPIVFRWDTKAVLQDTSLKESQRTVADGEHAIEVRSYTPDGRMAERAAVNVRVANHLPIRAGQPIYLAYKFRLGDATKYAYRYDLKATANQNSSSSAPSQVPDISYQEFTKVTSFVEDVDAGKAFMRERRASPITISFGDVPQAVPVDESSRYFEISPNGHTDLSTAMTREKRFPFYNQMLLPARSVRVGQSWRGIIKIWGGAFAEGGLVFPCTNTLESIEWEHGVPTARIKCVYQGKAKLNNPYAGIQNGLIEVKGTSIINLAPDSGKIVRAVHDLDGTLKLDTNQANQPGGSTTPGGYAGPGGPPGFAPPGGDSGRGPGYGGPPGYAAPGGPPGGYGGPPGSGAPVYDPTANQGGPIPGVPIYQTYGLKIHAVATIA